ncbi:MAG: hypothetical protein OEQ81_02450 [Flavobacteriaceae bacterium]|nr:hypothetical protein [Flavobacteriaceae bacterium]
MGRLLLVLGISMAIFSCGNKKAQSEKIGREVAGDTLVYRYVTKNTLVSKKLPEIEITVADDFTYVGNFGFEIIANSEEYPMDMRGKPIAAGDRYVFVSVDEDQHVEKLFVVQLEGFLAENDFIFNYNFDSAEYIGENKYRHNTWFYDSQKLAKENPGNEGAKTRAFLKGKGFKLEDEYMMSRFVGLASEDRKNEIILFYIEMLKKETGYSLDEYENFLSEKERDSINTALIERSKKSFSIVKG